jgi:hypothetical protein
MAQSYLFQLAQNRTETPLASVEYSDRMTMFTEALHGGLGSTVANTFQSALHSEPLLAEQQALDGRNVPVSSKASSSKPTIAQPPILHQKRCLRNQESPELPNPIP